MRSKLAWCVSALVVLGAAGCSVESGAGDEDADVQADALQSADNQRADTALETLLVKYFSQGDDYLKNASNDGSPAGYWIFAQTFDAVLDGVERTHGAHFGGLVGRSIAPRMRAAGREASSTTRRG